MRASTLFLLLKWLPRLALWLVECKGDMGRVKDRLDTHVRIEGFLLQVRAVTDAPATEIWSNFEKLGGSFAMMEPFLEECKRHGAFWRDPALRGAWFRERN